MNIWLVLGRPQWGGKIIFFPFFTGSRKVIPEKYFFGGKKSLGWHRMSPMWGKFFFAFLAWSQKVIPENGVFVIWHTFEIFVHFCRGRGGGSIIMWMICEHIQTSWFLHCFIKFSNLLMSPLIEFSACYMEFLLYSLKFSMKFPSCCMTLPSCSMK